MNYYDWMDYPVKVEHVDFIRRCIKNIVQRHNVQINDQTFSLDNRAFIMQIVYAEAGDLCAKWNYIPEESRHTMHRVGKMIESQCADLHAFWLKQLAQQIVVRQDGPKFPDEWTPEEKEDYAPQDDLRQLCDREQVHGDADEAQPTKDQDQALEQPHNQVASAEEVQVQPSVEEAKDVPVQEDDDKNPAEQGPNRGDSEESSEEGSDDSESSCDDVLLCNNVTRVCAEVKQWEKKLADYRTKKREVKEMAKQLKVQLGQLQDFWLASRTLQLFFSKNKHQ